MRNEIDNILVIKLRHIGDVILTTPVFEVLRHSYPNAFIAALVNKGTEAMLFHNPNINKILTVERVKNPVLDLLKQIDLMCNVRKLQFDLVLELTRRPSENSIAGKQPLWK